MNISENNNEIKLEGNGNITIQNSNGVNLYSFNLNNESEVRKYFQTFENELTVFSKKIQTLEKEIIDNSDLSLLNKLINNQLYIRKHFRVIKEAKYITPKDVLDLRYKTYQPFYYRRKTDINIFEALNNQQSVLIIGNSLSGKTRAVLEALRREEFADYQVIVPNLITDFIEFPLLESIPDIISSNRKQIVFLDDLHQYFQKQNANLFILNILRNEIPIIATCMTGPEYDIYLTNVESKIAEQFQLIEIPKISQEEYQIQNLYAIEGAEVERFDGNIGSLFMQLQVMERRYKELIKDKDNKTNSVAVQILHILKALYFSANYEQKSAYSKEKIQDFYFKLIDKKHERQVTNQLQQQLLAKIQKEEYEHILRNWQNAIDKLKSTYTDLNFITESNDKIRIEEVYFDRGIFAKEYSSQNLTEDILRLYPTDAERRLAGFYVKAIYFNSLIDKANNFQECINIFQQMKREKIKPTEVTFNILMNKAPDFDTTKSFFNKMVTEGLKPNARTFNILVHKAPTLEITRHFFDEMISEGIRPNEFTFNSLISKASNFEIGLFWREQMTIEGIKPNEVTFNSLINKAPDFESGKAFFDEMLILKLKPNEFTFSTLINKAPNFELGKSILDEMLKQNIEPNTVTFTTLINKAPNFELGKAFLDEMLEKGIKPNDVTFNTLMNKASDSETAKEFLDEMLKQGIKPDEFTFTTLINKAPNFELGKAFLDEMLKQNIKPDAFTFNTLMNKSSEFELSVQLLAKMQEKGIKPNKITFLTLIKFAESKQPLSMASLLQIKPDFEEHYYNKIVAAFFLHFDYISFIEQHFEEIVLLDTTIIQYALELEREHKEECNRLAFRLLSYVKTENAIFCNLMANLYRQTNSKINYQKVVEFYEKAAILEPEEKSKAKYYYNIASLIHENIYTEMYPLAILYCRKALSCKKSFEYSKELLIFLTAYTTNEDDIIEEINKLVREFGYNKGKTYSKIYSHFWELPEMAKKIQILKTTAKK